jgi:hypothetical protein
MAEFAVETLLLPPAVEFDPVCHCATNWSMRA